MNERVNWKGYKYIIHDYDRNFCVITMRWVNVSDSDQGDFRRRWVVDKSLDIWVCEPLPNTVHWWHRYESGRHRFVWIWFGIGTNVLKFLFWAVGYTILERQTRRPPEIRKFCCQKWQSSWQIYHISYWYSLISKTLDKLLGWNVDWLID